MTTEEFQRNKGILHLLLWKIAYKINNYGKIILGRTRWLKILLNLHWQLKRILFEESGKQFGLEFQESALATSSSLLLKYIKHGYRILDLGCGSGHWSNKAGLLGGEVTGVDSSASLLSQARNQYPGITFINQDIFSYIESSPNFDLVLLIHVLEHLESPSELLKKLLNKTRMILIEVPDMAADPLNWSRKQLKLPYYSDLDHLREYDLGSLINLIESSGWTVLESIIRGSSISVIVIYNPKN